MPDQLLVTQARQRLRQYLLDGQNAVSNALATIAGLTTAQLLGHSRDSSATAPVVEALGGELVSLLQKQIGRQLARVGLPAAFALRGTSIVRKHLERYVAAQQDSARKEIVESLLFAVRHDVGAAIEEEHMALDALTDLDTVTAFYAVDKSAPLVDEQALVDQMVLIVNERMRASGTMTVSEQVESVRHLGAALRTAEQERPR